MTGVQYETSEILIDKVSDWLKQASLRNTDLETVVRGCCERLAATGIPVKRIHMSLSMLHPLYRAMGFTWRRGEGLKVEGGDRAAIAPGEGDGRASPEHRHDEGGQIDGPPRRPRDRSRLRHWNAWRRRRP